MASTTTKVFFCVILINKFSSLLNAQPGVIHAPSFPSLRSCKFDKIYQLGDSISDTGNLILETQLAPSARLPYGETFFKKPTGRCSNGILMIDYIAWAAGLSFLDPYKNANASFENGANFAVAGATVISSQTLKEKNITNPATNSSLDVQLGWMSTHFTSLCKTTTDCIEKFKNTLFMVGEIGGNDYNYALLQRKTFAEVRGMVLDVVQGIMNATRRVIQLGAPRIIVPGNFPIGCMPIYLTAFKTNNLAAYDDQHCLKELNNLAMYHNEHLQKAIEVLKQESHNTTIVYGDYYKAFKWLLASATHFGFDVASLQKACCGTGGEYNFNLSQRCGAPNVLACSNPAQHISWDGIHLTQQAYKIMAAWLIKNILPLLNCRPLSSSSL